MVLAAELKLAGVDPVVLERRDTAALAGSRGGGFHSRTLELLDQRGITERFLAEGSTVNTVTFGSTTLDLAGLPTRHPYTLALFQNHVERLLLEWITELGVEVRRSAGIAFTGPDATRSSLIAEARADDGVGPGGKVDASGVHPMGDGTVRIVVTEAELAPPGADPTMADLRRELTAVFGTDFGVHDPVWLSRFTDATRQAETYRRGRVLVAGDAAHVHYPTGGMGIGLGIQDAVNLGWKLGRVMRGAAPDDLLDTYDAERRPAGARALGYTMGQSLFQRADGPVRLHSLLHAARPVLLELGGSELRVDGAEVDLVRATHDGPWVLPLLGEVPHPTGVLVRPDGHAAWVGEGDGAGLADALAPWR